MTYYQYLLYIFLGTSTTYYICRSFKSSITEYALPVLKGLKRFHARTTTFQEYSCQILQCLTNVNKYEPETTTSASNIRVIQYKWMLQIGRRLHTLRPHQPMTFRMPLRWQFQDIFLSDFLGIMKRMLKNFKTIFRKLIFALFAKIKHI